jgi:hypothetical protein
MLRQARDRLMRNSGIRITNDNTDPLRGLMPTAIYVGESEQILRNLIPHNNGDNNETT